MASRCEKEEVSAKLLWLHEQGLRAEKRRDLRLAIAAYEAALELAEQGSDALASHHLRWHLGSAQCRAARYRQAVAVLTPALLQSPPCKPDEADQVCPGRRIPSRVGPRRRRPSRWGLPLRAGACKVPKAGKPGAGRPAIGTGPSVAHPCDCKGSALRRGIWNLVCRRASAPSGGRGTTESESHQEDPTGSLQTRLIGRAPLP